MAHLAYNLSETITSNLIKIDELRKEILLFPLSLKNELIFRWEANISKIFWGLTLIDNPLTRKEMANIISNYHKKKLTKYEKDVFGQNRAFTYLRENWLVSNNQITLSTLRKLYDLSCKDTLGRQGSFTQISETEMKKVLEYLASGEEHPIIQAGIAQIQLTSITPFDNGNGRMSRLINYLYLYKFGYDFRGLLVLDEYFRLDPLAYRKALESIIGSLNQSAWLEYFTGAIVAQLEKTLTNLKAQKYHLDMPASYWNLNERQKQILSWLDSPGAKVSNKNVQKHFGVSQITASRDLANLTALGLLFSHGKGRSVFYTKV
jgi:Fic family protein